MRSCFAVLWNGLSAVKHQTILNARDRLRCQIQALRFLLLLDKESTTPSIARVSIYAEDAVAEFERSCDVVTEDDACFLLEEIRTLFCTCWTAGRGCEGDGPKQSIDTACSCTPYELVLIPVKVLCKAGHYNLASVFLNEIEKKVRGCADCTALALGNWAIKIHSMLKAEEESGKALRECARTLRSLSAAVDREAHGVLEGSGLVVWAVENGHSRGLSGPVLLAWFSFLEEQQVWITHTLKKVSLVVLCFLYSARRAGT